MLIHTETSLRNFQFWGGGADTANCLTYEQLDTIESILEDICPQGIDEVELNDLMWFDSDIIAEWLGFNDFEELKNQVCRGIKKFFMNLSLYCTNQNQSMSSYENEKRRIFRLKISLEIWRFYIKIVVLHIVLFLI